MAYNETPTKGTLMNRNPINRTKNWINTQKIPLAIGATLGVVIAFKVLTHKTDQVLPISSKTLDYLSEHRGAILYQVPGKGEFILQSATD